MAIDLDNIDPRFSKAQKMYSSYPQPSLSKYPSAQPKIFNPNYKSIFLTGMLKGLFVIAVVFAAYAYFMTLDLSFYNETMEVASEFGVGFMLDIEGIVTKGALYASIAAVAYIILTYQGKEWACRSGRYEKAINHGRNARPRRIIKDDQPEA